MMPELKFGRQMLVQGLDFRRQLVTCRICFFILTRSGRIGSDRFRARSFRLPTRRHYEIRLLTSLYHYDACI